MQFFIVHSTDRGYERYFNPVYIVSLEEIPRNGRDGPRYTHIKMTDGELFVAVEPIQKILEQIR